MKSFPGIFKCILLLVIAPMIIWKLSLKNTVELLRQNNKIEKMGSSMKDTNITQRPFQLQLPLQTEPYISSGKMIDILSKCVSAEHVDIINYSPYLSDAEGDYSLYSGVLMLTGSYISLVKVISFIEKPSFPVKIVSADFRIQQDPGKKERIVLTIILQQIEKLPRQAS